MRLLYPGAMFFLSFIPVIIAMYILKQKFEEREISSLYLWEQVIKDMDVNTPWQKLKSSLPLILQIIGTALLAFAIANPFLLLGKGAQQNIIAVIDNTGSMNTYFNDTTRLEEAKRRAEKLIKSQKPGSKITLITSGNSAKVELSASSDKEEAVNKVRNIKPSNSAGDLEDSLSLVKSLGKQYVSYKAVFFTDREVDISEIEGEVQALSSYSENVSLDYMSHAKEQGVIRAIVRVNNRSNNTQNREVALYAEEKLFTLKEVQLKPGEVKTVYFENIPTNIKYLHAELSEKDSLIEDNRIYEVIRETKSQRVLLVSERNVFVEKILSSLNYIELFKTNSAENIIDEYDLYIFDGISPEELPREGAVLFINPPEQNPLVKVKGEAQGNLGEIQKSQVTKYMENAQFTVAKYQDIEVPYWGSVFLKINNKPAAFLGDYKGKKTALLAFDLHNSDFPLISEFPIFMHNLVSYLVDGSFQGNTVYQCGEAIEINPKGEAENLVMKTPEGESFNIELKYPMKPFEKTNSIGIYRLMEEGKDKQYENLLAVNFPADKESEVNLEAKSVSSKINESVMDAAGIDLKIFIMIAVLLLLVIEWGVYIYGY
jgi:hypothetical protein